MTPYFSKTFKVHSLGRVDYVICEHCGMVVSKSHFEMSAERWQELNYDYHRAFQGSDECPDDPKWVQRLQDQKDVIKELAIHQIIPRVRPWVDWGCGDGKLSNLLGEEGFRLMKFDRYMSDSNSDYLSEKELKEQEFDLVITTSVFEHLLSVEFLDEINRLVSTNGVLATHTMVREVIPRNPEWFYLLPVHCTFHTNKSMEILFNRWGYKASVYSPLSRLWFFFKCDVDRIEQKIANLNKQKKHQTAETAYYFKKGFMDYWKQID